MSSRSFRRIAGIVARSASLLLVAAGVALAQSRAVAGTYSTSIESPQGAIKVTMVVKKTGATFGGTLAAEGFETIPISAVVPSDTLVQITADSPDGPVVVKVRFVGADSVKGTLNYQGMDMPLTGTFAPEAASGGDAAGRGASAAAARRSDIDRVVALRSAGRAVALQRAVVAAH